MENELFASAKVGSVGLRNHVVMSPMTRCRAVDNIPNALMAEYYGQRAGAGLIITEGTAPSPNGLGYARIPGMFSKEQVEGWKRTTGAVHEKGGKIFVQLMHTGRVSHPLNMPAGSRILAPSAVQAAGQMWTDQKQMQDFPVPEAMSADDVVNTKAEYVESAKNALEAGFDGIELHSANGYLLEQFLSPVTNVRKDSYGGNMDNRCRFVIEVAAAVADAIGRERAGIRLSPYGVFNDMPQYREIDATYSYLSEQLHRIGLAYIHIVDHSSMGGPVVPPEIKDLIREGFKNTIILSGGYDRSNAETDIELGLAGLVAFGRPFINNPDLVERMRNDWPLSVELHQDLFYTAGAKGYTDYPLYSHQPVHV
jgi:N-ethylmaleimide reductase